MTPAVIQVHSVEKTFGTKLQPTPVLVGINASFEQGKSYAIIGASGSGKSTLLHILGGLDSPTRGDVTFNGRSLSSFRASERNRLRNKQLGFVFQFHYLIHELTVQENVMLPGLIAGMNRSQCKERASELLRSVGLAHRETTLVSTLSGGEQQRVSVVRALFNKPAFLLADEPTGNLDAENGATVIALIERYQRDYGMGLVVCSHDEALYGRMGTVLTMKDGLLSL